MNIRQWLLGWCLLGLGLSASANRIVDQPEDAYETWLEHVTLPSSTAGYVIFKPCAACANQSLRVTSNTVYLLDGEPHPLAELAEEAARMRDSLGPKRTAVYIFRDIETDAVNRLVLDRLED